MRDVDDEVLKTVNAALFEAIVGSVLTPSPTFVRLMQGVHTRYRAEHGDSEAVRAFEALR